LNANGGSVGRDFLTSDHEYKTDHNTARKQQGKMSRTSIQRILQQSDIQVSHANASSWTTFFKCQFSSERLCCWPASQGPAPSSSRTAVLTSSSHHDGIGCTLKHRPPLKGKRRGRQRRHQLLPLHGFWMKRKRDWLM